MVWNDIRGLLGSVDLICLVHPHTIISFNELIKVDGRANDDISLLVKVFRKILWLKGHFIVLDFIIILLG